MIAFKEKEGDNNQYYKDTDGKWKRCNENYISSLWLKWVTADNSKPQYEDNEGFTIFEYK